MPRVSRRTGRRDGMGPGSEDSPGPVSNFGRRSGAPTRVRGRAHFQAKGPSVRLKKARSLKDLEQSP